MKTHLPALLSTALLALSLTAPLLVSAAPAEVLSSMKVDHRGLLEIPGVLRGSNDHHWGAANLIAFGPGWQYSAQDWALADTQKTGDSLEARLKVGGAQVRVAQRWGMKTRADGSKGMEMTWRLFNPEQKPMGLERAYVTFPLATDDWGGCTIEADGKTLELPAEKGASASLGWMTFSSLRIQGKTKQGKPLNFRITGEKLLAEVYDARHEKKTCYELRLALPDVKAGASSAVTFCISASVLPFYFQPGEEWVEYPFTRTVQPGSILDFSTVLPVDAPAGKHGRIVTGKTTMLLNAGVGATANLHPWEELKRKILDAAHSPWQNQTIGMATHEQYSFRSYVNYIPDHLDRVEACCRLVTELGYKPVYFAEGLLGNTAWDAE